MLNKYTKITIILTVFLFLLFTNIYNAQSAIIGGVENCNCDESGKTDDCRKYCEGDYGLNDFVQIIVNWYQRILGFIGSIALLMFVYGGVMFLISGGSSEKVGQAKQIMINAIIGLVIVFASFMIIQFIFTTLDIQGTEDGGWATSDWTSWFK
jgi:hypothetical protein